MVPIVVMNGSPWLRMVVNGYEWLRVYESVQLGDTSTQRMRYNGYSGWAENIFGQEIGVAFSQGEVVVSSSSFLDPQ